MVLDSAPLHLPILDWGCGNGHVSCFLLEAGYSQIHCYAFRPPALIGSEACRDGRMTIHVANKHHGSSIPLPSGFFQTVLSIGVLEHVRETGGTEIESLREINRILRDGGRLIGYHLPNALSPIEALSRLLPGKYHHQYLFRRNQVANLLDQAGFSVEFITLYGVLPRNLFSGPLSCLGNQVFLCDCLEYLDRILSFLFRPSCQNFAFVAIKPGEPK
ncbi:bifunctional 2-polyprenyl-6-hydroxyphenol methylase/3-demethylubiquinol 3-O-methyltransferase UbiG [Synechococcus sp. CS-1328]|uniref:class I SAM-dependent methyltransferase n=1 Tax=Synechococcus sp. CS-1328 TaxID=2847976 RepID=UPI00223A8ED9|nr:class I SAM-dependent methyltransferase [Synechococcus sp. CS-1328]MCT0223989.1 class I SAM-dependent methyltransferase [Synechococcus sp. CS-1328]